jgi:uncharacterized damage-inducible protein DinB
MKPVALYLSVAALLVAATTSAQPQRQPPSPQQALMAHFASVNKRLLEMAKDFPADKYGYKPTPEVRTFGEVLVHVVAGNVYAAKAAQDPAANWDEIDAGKYKTKPEIVAALEKSVNDATAALKATPADRFGKSPEPWLSVIEHAGEHYGQLVVYYRANGLVPPASRPKKTP